MLNSKKTFKAAVLFEQNKPLKVIDLNFPEKLEKGQLLIKIISAAICGAQIGEIRGVKGPDKWLPHCMGHEGYGVVVAKNSSSKKVKVNDKVILHWRKGSGLNAKPANYHSKKYGQINAGQVTTFQEYAVVSENRVTKVKLINKKNKFLAPLLGCAIPTSWGIINKELKIKKNDNVLILGAGGIGTTIFTLLKINKNNKCLLVDKYHSKSKFINRIKAKYLDIKNLKKINEKFDHVIDTTGDTDVMRRGFNFVKKNGKIIFVGQPKKGGKLIINDPLRLFNHPNDHVKIITSDGGLFNPKKDMKYIEKLLIKNKSEFSRLLSHKFSLVDINKGLKFAFRGKSLRVGITN